MHDWHLAHGFPLCGLPLRRSARARSRRPRPDRQRFAGVRGGCLHAESRASCSGSCLSGAAWPRADARGIIICSGMPRLHREQGMRDARGMAAVTAQATDAR